MEILSGAMCIARITAIGMSFIPRQGGMSLTSNGSIRTGRLACHVGR